MSERARRVHVSGVPGHSPRIKNAELMDFTDIEKILELMRQHDLAEFELDREGLKLRVRKAGAPPVFHAGPMQTMPVMAGAVPAVAPPAAPPPAAPAPEAPAA